MCYSGSCFLDKGVAAAPSMLSQLYNKWRPVRSPLMQSCLSSDTEKMDIMGATWSGFGQHFVSQEASWAQACLQEMPASCTNNRTKSCMYLLNITVSFHFMKKKSLKHCERCFVFQGTRNCAWRSYFWEAKAVLETK